MITVKLPGFVFFGVSKNSPQLPQKIALHIENRRVLLRFHYSVIFCKLQFLWWAADTAPAHLESDLIVCHGFHFLWVITDVYNCEEPDSASAEKPAAPDSNDIFSCSLFAEAESAFPEFLFT